MKLSDKQLTVLVLFTFALGALVSAAAVTP